VKPLLLCTILAAAGATAAPAQQRDGQTSDAQDIREWTVPWERTRPRDPYVDAQGRVWFVGQAGHYVAYLNPTSGEFKRYELEPGAGPHNQVVDDKGMVWFTGNRVGYIGRLDPQSGAIVKYPMPDTTIRDPHTAIFDKKGNLWFTAQGGNVIGRLTVASGKVELVKVPTARARPYGILVDSKNTPWIVLFGTNKLATIDPATMQLKEIALPREETRPRRIAITSDDKIWYGDYREGRVGRYDPATGKVDEWLLPGGPTSRPYAMASDDQDRVWLAETGSQPNRLVAFDPRTGTFVSELDVPSGGGTVRHMVFDKSTRAIWFGTDNNTIGRALVPTLVP
jgi:virginiamycin B lyase